MDDGGCPDEGVPERRRIGEAESGCSTGDGLVHGKDALGEGRGHASFEPGAQEAATAAPAPALPNVLLQSVAAVHSKRINCTPAVGQALVATRIRPQHNPDRQADDPGHANPAALATSGIGIPNRSCSQQEPQRDK